MEIRIAFASSWNIACGIAVYTKHVSEAMAAKGHTVFNYPNTWTNEEYLRTIDQNKPNIINFQYEPILFNDFGKLLALLGEIRARGIKIVFTLHSEPHQVLTLRSYVDMFLYHRPPTIPLIRASHIPMGVPSYEPSMSRSELRAKYGYTDSDIIFATTGFAFRWKMFPDVLGAMRRHLRNDPRYRVQLLISNSDINHGETSAEIARANQVAQIAPNQIWINQGAFLSQEELSDRLYISDVGYLWSGITTSSSSAAGKEFITSRLPIVITDSSHYHDLTSVAVYVTPKNVSQFVGRVFKATHNVEVLGRARRAMEIRYNTLNYMNHVDKFIEVYERTLHG